ncbi:MAG: hypothetical protein GXO74_08745 [Calditrichaeota bacterium]|nr:hypothetical protein [Calditrichota bacterium]
MKKILLLNFDGKTVGDLQAEYARQCEFFSTTNFEDALRLVKRELIALIFIKAPEWDNIRVAQDLKIFLKKTNKRRYKRIKKILIAEEGGEADIEGFMKYGISAVILDVGEVGRWV